MANLREHVNNLNQEIMKGNILGAFEQYYAEDCQMKEPGKEPRVGKDANREYEKGFVDAVDEWHNVQVRNVAVDEKNNTSAVEWSMDFTMGGNRLQREQVAVQEWKNGKIAKETFYYNG